MKNVLILIFVLSLFPFCTARAEPTEWTYAFYLASGDGFYREQNRNFMEICDGAESVTNGKVVVFIDVEPEKGKISPLHLRKGSYAFEVTSCEKLKRLDIPALGLDKNQQTDLNSSTPAVIKGFFDFVKSNYPSHHKFYDLTAHGDVLINPRHGSINSLSIAQALKENRPEVLALDMCYLGGLESLWDLKDAADTIVAASTTIPLSVNDYSRFLKRVGSGSKPATAVAKDFVEAYRQTYAGKKYPVSIFALKAGAGLEQFVANFSRRIADFSDTPEAFDKVKAEKAAKSNLYGTNADLTAVIAAMAPNLPLELQKLLYDEFSVNTVFSGPAVFFPADQKTYEKHRDEYQTLMFSRNNPAWPKFLDGFYRPQ